jgi:hypothetical protein
MRPPIRRFAPIGAGTLVIALAAATAFLAAQDRSQPGPKICLTSAGNVSGEGPFLAENDAAMKKMMSGMAITPTGDVDLDFVAMMVPHHQGGSTWPSQSFATVATHRSGGWPRKSSSPSSRRSLPCASQSANHCRYPRRHPRNLCRARPTRTLMTE